MESPSPLKLPETFCCAECGEEYRGFKFYSKHLKEEHGKEAEYDSAPRARQSFTIIAGKPRQNKEEDKEGRLMLEEYQVGDQANF